jgi:hypothetical protein
LVAGCNDHVVSKTTIDSQIGILFLKRTKYNAIKDNFKIYFPRKDHVSNLCSSPKKVEGKKTHVSFLKAFLNLMIRNIET